MTAKLAATQQQINIAKDGTISLQIGSFTLADGFPTVNGTALQNVTVRQVTETSDQIQATYKTAEFSFSLQVSLAETDSLEIKLSLHDFQQAATWHDFGLRFDTVIGAKRALRQGFYSWDGTEFFNFDETLKRLDPLETYLDFSPRASHSVTALLDGENTAVIGVTQSKRMPQTFLFTMQEDESISLDINFHWENASTNGLPELAADPLRLFVGADTEKTLRRWAKCFAAEMGGGRVASHPMRGWCSWYYLYYFATEQEIEENLAGAIKARDEEGIPLDVFLIDANHAAQLGDWLEPNLGHYPNGQQRLIKMIKEAGFIPGLWIGPYWVTNRSKLFQEHPEWMVQDPNGGPLIIAKMYGEQKIWCYPVEEAYILDATHPGVQAYLRQVIETWRAWGVEYFKTDFMYMGAIPGVRHDPTKNRLAVWRETAEMMRDAMGDAYWSGCGQPHFPSVGLVDSNRVSGDVGPVWRGHLSQESTLRDTLNRHFMHNIFWQNDPDCVLIRDFHHELTDNEVQGLGLYAGMSGGLCLTSDPLHLVSPERREFLRFLAPKQTNTPRAPLMGQEPESLRCFVSDGPNDAHVAFFLNSGEEPIRKEIPLADLGLPDQLHALAWLPDADLGAVKTLSVDLAPHASYLVYLKPTAFNGWEPAYLLDYPEA